MDQVHPPSTTGQRLNLYVHFSVCFLIESLCSEQANDSGLASYVAGQIDRTLSWKVNMISRKDFAQHDQNLLMHETLPVSE
jgi:hypothetical protein